jgi:hypothetical protein
VVNDQPYEDPNDNTRLIYDLNVTLLPNQILVLPKNLEKRINQSIFDTYTTYTDFEIRYSTKFSLNVQILITIFFVGNL